VIRNAPERRLLRMPDTRFDFALAVGITDATRQRDDAVVREHVAVERIEGRVVHVRREDPFLQMVEDDHTHRPTKATKRALVKLGPDVRARLPYEQPDSFARVAERQDEEACPPVLARLRMANHRTVAVVDLSFFAGRGGDHDAGLGRGGPAEHHDEAPHAGIPGGETGVVDEVLPDGHGVGASPELDDQLSIRLARARARRAPGAGPEPSRRTPPPWWPVLLRQSRWTLLGNGRFCRTRIGGQQRRGNCRFCNRFARALSSTHRDPRGSQVTPDGLAAHAGALLDARERPTETAKCEDLLSCGAAQDVAHAGDRTCVLRPGQRLGRVS